jgi:predicted permease
MTLAQIKRVLRRFQRAPLFTTISLMTLALVVGVNTVTFSVVDSVLLKPLPYPHPERLIAVDHTSQQMGFETIGISPSIVFIYRDQSTTLEDIGAYDNDEVDVTGAGTPEHVQVLDVTDGTLRILGVAPILGRLFTRHDDSPGSAATALLTYRYWKEKFGGASSAIGSTITVGGVPREIIGVLPQRFHFLDQKDPSLILPFQWDRGTTTLGGFNYQAIARLKAGATLQQANADLEHLLPVVLRTFPPAGGFSVSSYEVAQYAPSLKPLKQEVIGNVQNVLWVLMGSTILVFLIACANVANLMIIRVEGRHHEFSILYAIGAARKSISADIILECGLLGLAGSLIGLALAAATIHLVVAIGSVNIPRVGETSINAAVLLFTLAMALTASLFMACIPIIRSTGAHLLADLREGGRGVGDGRNQQNTRKALVILQVAFSLVLLICSGLMIRTFRAMMHVSPGFTSPQTVQTFGFFIPETQIPDSQSERVVRMDEEIIERISSIPGVSSVSVGRSVPMDENTSNQPVYVEDQRYDSNEIPPIRRFNFVAPGFFSTLGTRLIAGRDFSWTDTYEKRRVAIVSASFAREYWHSPRAALGKRVRVADTDQWREITGVAEDVHYDGVDRPAPSMIYWPLMMDYFAGREQRLQRPIVFTIRSPVAGSQSLMKAVQQQVWLVNPNVPLANSRTLGQLYTKSIARTSFTLVMLCISGGIALLLGTVGIYGVIAYSVSQRTREIGIQMALGAQRNTVITKFVGQGMWLTMIGVVIGMGIAFATTRFMSALLFGVTTVDPITYIIVACAVIGAALPACYLPSRHAAKVDPVLALRG